VEGGGEAGGRGRERAVVGVEEALVMGGKVAV
jgi:hypothetical protein